MLKIARNKCHLFFQQNKIKELEIHHKTYEECLKELNNLKSKVQQLTLEMMICRRLTYFTDLEIIEYYQKTCNWNNTSTKIKNYVISYARYTTLKNHSLWFILGREYQKTLIYN